MTDLLASPAVQSGAVPFFVALIIALALRPLGWAWAGLSLAAGFYAAAHLIESGLDFSALNSTRKVLLLGLAAVIVGALVELLADRHRIPVFAVLALLAGAGGLWVVAPVLGRQDGMAWAMLATGAFVYPAWHAAWSAELRDDTLRYATAGWVLALATAACAIMAASARLGQLSIALGAAAGAFCLAVVLVKGVRGGALFALPAALLGALLGLVAAVFARLPWYGLAVLALVPVLARLPLPAHWPRPIRAIVLALYTIPAAALAVWLVWQQSSAAGSGYGY